MRRGAKRTLLLVTVGLLARGALVTPAAAQTGGATGFELGGVPAINFDSDEGFGYGALAELYQYGDGTRGPYLWTARPTVFLTTGGRRDVTLFLDSPHLMAGWRVDGFVGFEKRITTPYYGVGNASVFDPALDDPDGPNPDFYGFGRTRRSVQFNLQRYLGSSPLRFLFGGGAVATTIETVPDGIGTSLYEQEVGPTDGTEWTNYVRGGLVWDTRDRETAPRRGTWTELLVHWTDPRFAADVSFTRWTLIDRRYLSLTERLVLAHRVLVQGTDGDVPVHELNTVSTSFRQQEGLGGAKTVRGILKNRFLGRGMLVWNAELRWRLADFSMVGRPFHAVLSAFVDQGRVWASRVHLDQLVSDLHRGYGGGVRLGMGENFVVAVDVGTSDETGLQTYVGLGYLY